MTIHSSMMVRSIPALPRLPARLRLEMNGPNIEAAYLNLKHLRPPRSTTDL
jgi:hypothetical protein